MNGTVRQDDGALARPLPAIDDDNRAFWTGGAQGQLLIARCQACGYLIHPPTSFCPSCEGRDVLPQPVSGLGTILSLTVNHKPWFPEQPVPYMVALVSLDEQAEVQLVTNIVDCDPLSVTIGDRVEVCFEAAEDLWVPLFRPIDAPRNGR